MTVTKHPWSVMRCGVSGEKADGLRGGHRTGSLPPAVPKAAPVLWGAEGRGGATARCCVPQMRGCGGTSSERCPGYAGVAANGDALSWVLCPHVMSCQVSAPGLAHIRDHPHL